MNITLAVDEKTVREARAAAHAMGKSLDQAIRDHLEALAGAERTALEVEELWSTAGTGNSRGWRFDRDAAYEGRSDRFSSSADAHEEP